MSSSVLQRDFVHFYLFNSYILNSHNQLKVLLHELIEENKQSAQVYTKALLTMEIHEDLLFRNVPFVLR